MRRKLVVGNWKMNGSLAQNDRLLAALRAGWTAGGATEVAACVPFPYLAQVQALLTGSPLRWGAQDMSEFDAGAYTGEVSGAMLREFGCAFVIVGHSERRQLFAEDDRTVARKAIAALRAGLTPIVCVGETLAEREQGVTGEVVARQWAAVAEAVGARSSEVVVAYEPVWAIGTGRTASPEQAQEVHLRIRSLLAEIRAEGVPVLYGGSVKGSNAKALFAMPDIDGGLVGGASLDADDFLTIARAME